MSFTQKPKICLCIFPTENWKLPFLITLACSFSLAENLKIEWPEDDDDEEPPPKEAQSLVEKLLVQDPDMRLGSQALGGTYVQSVQCVAVFMQFMLNVEC